MGELNRRKGYATKRIALCVQHSGQQTAWSPVQYVKAIEFLGVEENSAWRIEVRNDANVDPDFTYLHKGTGLKTVNIPRGDIRLVRVKGTQPITAYAHCGP